MFQKTKYYSLDKILKANAQYNMIIGERSNGKTYSTLEYAVKKWVERGEQTAIVRRWAEDLRGKRAQTIFSSLVSNGFISDITGGQWNGVYYYAGRWYLMATDGDKKVVDSEPFAFAFAIASQEHDKSTSYPNITTIIFDEFISRTSYLPDEFVLFMNVISTIVRDRKNVKIFMLGNTVNKYCPYFNEMGLKHIKQMKQGTIDVYRYGQSGLSVAVEYTKPNAKGKASDLYFAFDNPKLSMITGGGWEIGIYPHCPVKYKPRDIKFTYFVQFDGDILQCEIVKIDGQYFTFVHKKTTPIKNPEKDLIFTPEYSYFRNYRTKITKPFDDVGKMIAGFFMRDKVFYQDNETGEIMRNYLLWCNKQN